jgi:phage tail sheath protein FI
MAFQLSPGVVTTEIDLTTVIPVISTTAGGFVGDFLWGPANTVVTINSENTLASVFGKPTNDNYLSFMTAASFLAYGNNLKVVRAINASSKNATSNGGGVLIQNDDVWFNNYRSSTTTNTAWGNTTAEIGFAAKHAGTLGNSIKVAFLHAGNTSLFTNWAYQSFFDSAPGTSDYAETRGSTNDEIHIVVVDAKGDIASSGTPAGTNAAGAVLETFPYVSVAADAKNSDGSSNFYVDVLASKSNWVRWLAHPANTTNWGTTATNGVTFSGINGFSAALANGTTLTGGAYTAATDANKQIGWDLFKSETVDVSLLVTGDASATVGAYVIDNVAELRKDCVAFLSPASANVVNNPGGEVTAIKTQKNTNINRSTSYAVFDSAWKYMFDKYNNTYRWIPLNADIAGLCVRTDSTRDPWFSPAGLNRGQVKNSIKLSWNPTKTDRDELYKAGINPVVSFPGEGTVLFGDKTMLSKPSAFDRINVRRLFIVLEKAIATAAKYSLFEFNDEFTRSQFVSLVEPFLREVQGRRGIFDYRVVCDETNNTAEIIDRNEFVGDIYIKPARSINFIQLNFVAVRSGVAFDEIVGRF